VTAAVLDIFVCVLIRYLLVQTKISDKIRFVDLNSSSDLFTSADSLSSDDSTGSKAIRRIEAEMLDSYHRESFGLGLEEYRECMKVISIWYVAIDVKVTSVHTDSEPISTESEKSCILNSSTNSEDNEDPMPQNLSD
jgi:hypothetical protein